MKTGKRIAIAALMSLALAVPSITAAAGDEPSSLAGELEASFTEAVRKVAPAYVMIGGGSGVCISPDGLMLTNHHVAGSVKEWSVNMPNFSGGEPYSFKAELLGQDPTGDICLLKIKADRDLPYVPLGDSDAIKIGDPVVVLGNPFMFALDDSQPTVTLGVISVLHKLQGNYTDAIQTDAAINPGNSGGPLISFDGKLLGINGQVAVRFGNRHNTGAGYAIPAGQIRNFMRDLTEAKGQIVPHAKLNGLVFSPDESEGAGVLISEVRPNTTAFKAGFKPGDKVIGFNQYDIYNRFRFRSVLGTYPAGAEVELRVLRDGKQETLTVALDSMATVDAESPYMGIHPDDDYKGEGIRIMRCEKDSGADHAGLSPGDVLLSIEGQEVNSLEDVQELLSGGKVGDKIKVLYARDGERRSAWVILGARPHGD